LGRLERQDLAALSMIEELSIAKARHDADWALYTQSSEYAMAMSQENLRQRGLNVRAMIPQLGASERQEDRQQREDERREEFRQRVGPLYKEGEVPASTDEEFNADRQWRQMLHKQKVAQDQKASLEELRKQAKGLYSDDPKDQARFDFAEDVGDFGRIRNEIEAERRSAGAAGSVARRLGLGGEVADAGLTADQAIATAREARLQEGDGGDGAGKPLSGYDQDRRRAATTRDALSAAKATWTTLDPDGEIKLRFKHRPNVYYRYEVLRSLVLRSGRNQPLFTAQEFQELREMVALYGTAEDKANLRARGMNQPAAAGAPFAPFSGSSAGAKIPGPTTAGAPSAPSSGSSAGAEIPGPTTSGLGSFRRGPSPTTVDLADHFPGLRTDPTTSARIPSISVPLTEQQKAELPPDTRILTQGPVNQGWIRNIWSLQSEGKAFFWAPQGQFVAVPMTGLRDMEAKGWRHVSPWAVAGIPEPMRPSTLGADVAGGARQFGRGVQEVGRELGKRVIRAGTQVIGQHRQRGAQEVGRELNLVQASLHGPSNIPVWARKWAKSEARRLSREYPGSSVTEDLWYKIMTWRWQALRGQFKSFHDDIQEKRWYDMKWDAHPGFTSPPRHPPKKGKK